MELGEDPTPEWPQGEGSPYWQNISAGANLTGDSPPLDWLPEGVPRFVSNQGSQGSLTGG